MQRGQGAGRAELAACPRFPLAQRGEGRALRPLAPQGAAVLAGQPRRGCHGGGEGFVVCEGFVFLA